jgi:superoxide dismutase, Cu-Zn family
MTKKTALKSSLLLLIPVLAFAADREKGVARLQPTAKESALTGTVSFEETDDGLKIVAEISGAPAGEHGFHIHEFGSCDDAGKAAGAHYNPLSSPHGHVHKDGPKKAHAGDLGNVTVGEDGKAKLEATLPKLGLSAGKFNVGGRAVILHEKADDFSQPAGNAGGRIACGIIQITGKAVPKE